MPRKNVNSPATLPVTISYRSRGKPSRAAPLPPQPPLPQSRSYVRKSRPRRPNIRRKGLLSGALDVAETVAGVLPGAIRGIRGIFNMREASYATPASFACVQNNISQMKSEQPVDHPLLGVAGMRISGSQPFAVILSGPASFFTTDSAGANALDDNTIPLNPILLTGPLSVYGYLYDRFVIRALKFKFTTYQPTSTPGIIGFCVENDVSNLMATSFDTLRQVLPNVTFPVRIPKAELDYFYEGPDLFYCQGASATSAEKRQNIQSVFKGYDAIPPASGIVYGFVDLEYVVDFFDPVPPISILGRSDSERFALVELRRAFDPPPPVARPIPVFRPERLAQLRDMFERDRKPVLLSLSRESSTEHVPSSSAE